MSSARASGDKRIFVVGGAGSLFVDDQILKDTAGFPEAYKAESETDTKALELLRAASPSPLDADLPCTGDRSG